MPANADLKEYIAWEKKQNSFWANITKSMNASHAFAFAGLILFSIYLVSKADVNKNLVYIGVIVIVIAIIWKNYKKEKDPIPEPIIKIIAEQNMSRSTDFPAGTKIEPMAYCKMRYEGEWGAPFRPWKWEVGFRVHYPDFREEEILVILNPYDGYVTGKIKKPTGYTGEESHDLKVLLPTSFTVKEEKKREG